MLEIFTRENHSDLQARSASPPPGTMKKTEQRMLLYPSTVDCILVSGKREVKCALEPTRYQQWVSCGWQTVALLAPSQKTQPRYRPHSSVLKEPPNGPPADWKQNVCVLQLAASRQAKWCHWRLLGEGYGWCAGSSPLLEEGEEGRVSSQTATSAEASLLHPGPPPSSPHPSRLQTYLQRNTRLPSLTSAMLGCITSARSIIRWATHVQKDRRIRKCNEQGWEVQAKSFILISISSSSYSLLSWPST